MKYLNLTKGFNPYRAVEEDCIQFESFFFNGGEPHVKIKPYSDVLEDVQITSRLTSMDDFMMLRVAIDALFGLGTHRAVSLFIPYFSGGRQDRVNISGEPLTVKIFADILNECELNLITTFDNHSDVATAVVDVCHDLNNHEFVDAAMMLAFNNNEANFDNCVIISPDSGSNKKVKDLMRHLNEDLFDSAGGYYPMVKCDKTRCVRTGNITGFEVYSNDLGGADCFIVDDICDGGGTFIGLAKELKEKNAGDIYLIVSHGIFSKPLKELKPYFKKIYTTDSWRSEFSSERQERDCTDLVEIIPFYEFVS